MAADAHPTTAHVSLHDRRFYTRAYLVTPDADTISPKKAALRNAGRHKLSYIAVRARKVALSRAFRLVIQSQVDHRLDQFVACLANDYPRWDIAAVPLEDAEAAEFAGISIVTTEAHLSGGTQSSGDELSAMSIDIGSTASARLVRETEERAARALAEERRRTAAAVAREQAEHQRAEEERQRAAEERQRAAEERQRADAAEQAALAERMEELQEDGVTSVAAYVAARGREPRGVTLRALRMLEAAGAAAAT